MPVETKTCEDDKEYMVYVYYVINKETGEYEPVGTVDAIGEYDGEE